MRSMRWLLRSAGPGAALAVAAALANHVPLFLDEVGLARADRSGWSQAAEFASLILDSGWAWAALAVLAGWLVTAGLRPTPATAAAGAAAGCVALFTATLCYYLAEWVLVDQPLGWGYVTRYWFVAGALFGPVLGAIGATIRRSGPAGILAALVAPAGAALQMVVLPPPAESLMATPVRVVVWLSAAAIAVFVLGRASAPRRPGFGDPLTG